MGIDRLPTYLGMPRSPYPLAIFRIAFGLLMFGSQIRFLAKGWVADLYIDPPFHFPYRGFEWVQVLPASWMYALVICCALCALLIALGLIYRLATISFFLSFTYLELIDKTWYLNHYYFISLVGFLMIFIPAHRAWSLDNLIRGRKVPLAVPQWSLWILQFQLGIVYVFAGIAKLKYDWLIKGEPMKTWLSARTDFPLIGTYFDSDWMAYLFSWGGTLYDLFIVFFLLNRRTRPWAYVAVWGFHVMTWLLFPIGMFPWIMIAATLVFFDENDWQKIFPRIGDHFETKPQPASILRLAIISLAIYMLIQVSLPLRHFILPGDVLWNEKGLRFAWHVMVMEKNGMVTYYMHDPESGKKWTETPNRYLIPAQTRQMAFQPDMIQQFGEFLEKEWEKKGYPDIQVEIENRVCVNKECKTMRWNLADSFP